MYVAVFALLRPLHSAHIAKIFPNDESEVLGSRRGVFIAS